MPLSRMDVYIPTGGQYLRGYLRWTYIPQGILDGSDTSRGRLIVTPTSQMEVARSRKIVVQIDKTFDGSQRHVFFNGSV